MESKPETALPCSQEPVIGPYPEPDEPTPNPFSLISILILSWYLQSGIFLSIVVKTTFLRLFIFKNKCYP
jgi:hypothetical protein